MTTETKTFYPNGYTDSVGSKNSGLSNPVGKGSANTSESARAEIVSVSGTEGSCKWTFDVSPIPANAEIDSVSCKATVGAKTALKLPDLQMYSGSTAKGSKITPSSETTNTWTLDVGSWTREELNDIRIRVYIKNTNTSSRTAYFYGADLTVTYTHNSEKFMLKTGGVWCDAARVFKKINGIWVEQTELSNVIEDGVRYQNGGEIISPKKTVTITGTGDNNASTTAAECYVEINGVKYVSATTVEVDSGTTMLCYAYAASASITLNGSSVGSGTPKQYTHTVNENCTVTLSVDASISSRATIAITTQ